MKHLKFTDIDARSTNCLVLGKIGNSHPYGD